MRISVFGPGYVGTGSATCLAADGVRTSGSGTGRKSVTSRALLHLWDFMAAGPRSDNKTAADGMMFGKVGDRAGWGPGWF